LKASKASYLGVLAMMERGCVRRFLLVWLAAFVLQDHAAADDVLSGRAGLAEAEMAPQRAAKCSELRTALRDLPDTERRIDLWVEGNAVGMQTDGALWYVLLCASPDIRVLCVTYERNEMKVGDYVQARGAYSRRDEDHVMLDPCLAGPPDEAR
jgi:hypothetical protein